MAKGDSIFRANQFANSFMRGFSFIDDINHRKRQEAKLDIRLEEETVLICGVTDHSGVDDLDSLMLVREQQLESAQKSRETETRRLARACRALRSKRQSRDVWRSRLSVQTGCLRPNLSQADARFGDRSDTGR